MSVFKKLLKKLKPLWNLWIQFGNLLGKINATIILTLLYILLITPIGMMRRLLGKDELFKKRKSQQSFWSDFPHKEHSIEFSKRQF
ncbi:MAG: hypothetical protein HYS98_05510 [Deltaproteobacteria bacterium]|nr:hypothetical protein [Deltaproteobacteria bacterium]